MKSSDIGKLGFVIAALAVAGWLIAATFRGDPTDQEQLWRICGNPACGAEYSVLRAESRQAAREHRQLACPKCGSLEAAMAYQCVKCTRATLAGVHGALPAACKHCQASPFIPKSRD